SQRATRPWSVIDLGFDLETSKRVPTLASEASRAAEAAAESPSIVLAQAIESTLIVESLRKHDAAIPSAACPRTGRPQFSAHQPDTSPAGHELHGVVQSDRAAVDPRSVHRYLALLLRPGFERGQEGQVSQHARLLHPGAQGRGAAGRFCPGDPGEPVRCNRR